MNIGVKFAEKLVKNGWNKIPKGLIKQSLLNCFLKVCVKLFIRCVFLNRRYAHIRFLYDIMRNVQFGANKQKKKIRRILQKGTETGSQRDAGMLSGSTAAGWAF